MKKIICVAITIMIALLPVLGFTENKPQETPERLQEKKIVMIIAQRMFQETEFKEPKEIFEKEGATVVVASSKLSPATGGKLSVQPDILITDIKAADYDAVVFIGGFGVSEYVNDYQAHKIAKDAIKQNKILAAICMAPRVLANAGLLEGKKATSAHKYDIEAKGAICTDKPVERDGNIITANGPGAARQFGEAIVYALSE